jgi:Galactose oxidase, central domain
MHMHRRNHTATLLPDGTVLVTGGEYDTTGSCTSAELYDPGSGSWTATWNLVMPRFINFTATLLADGTVLVAGGNDYGSGILASAELYVPGNR